MPTELGVKMMAALSAVRDLHDDASKLLKDLDSWMDKRNFGRFGDDAVSLGYSADIKKHSYMANCLFRRWSTVSDARCLRAVNIIFFDNGDRFDEPMIIAAELHYLDAIPRFGDGHIHAWATWSKGARTVGDVQVLSPGALDGRIAGGAVIAECLSSINTPDRSGELFDRIKAARIEGLSD